MNEKSSCPACGAPIMAPDNAQTVQCKFCNTTVKIREAIGKQEIQVNISHDADAQNDLIRGEQFLAVEDWESAHRAYAAALTKDADSYEGWKGILCALTEGFSQPTQLTQWAAPLDGIYGLKSAVQNIYQYVPNDKERENLTKLLRTIADIWIREMGSVADQTEGEYLRYKKKVRRWGWISACSLALLVLMIDSIIKFAAENNVSPIPIAVLPTIFFCIPLLIRKRKVSKRNGKEPAYLKSQGNMDQINQFNDIISPYASGNPDPAKGIPDSAGQDALAEQA